MYIYDIHTCTCVDWFWDPIFILMWVRGGVQLSDSQSYLVITEQSWYKLLCTELVNSAIKISLLIWTLLAMCMYAYICIYTYMYIYMYMCVWISVRIYVFLIATHGLLGQAIMQATHMLQSETHVYNTCSTTVILQHMPLLLSYCNTCLCYCHTATHAFATVILQHMPLLLSYPCVTAVILQHMSSYWTSTQYLLLLNISLNMCCYWIYYWTCSMRVWLIDIFTYLCIATVMLQHMSTHVIGIMTCYCHVATNV